MQRRKSSRHVRAANARWRAAETRAQADRDAGIEDAPMPTDVRTAQTLDLRDHGGPLVRIEPRLGYCSCRFIDADTGAMLMCCTLKQGLIELSRRLPAVRRHD